MNKLFATILLALPLVACEKANTTPPVTKPAVTTPVETKPSETKKDETKSAETKPVETAQPATKPAEQPKPAETKPAETKPAETKPVETKPAEKPVETKPTETKPASTVTPAGTTPAATPPAEKKAETTTPAPAAAKVYYVQFETTKGNIVIELNNEKAPISTANFLKYVDKGHYAGTIFHRVMAGFMIQGGGFTKDGVPKATEAPIKNEWQNGLKNLRGTLSMARTSVPDSATSQFFINVVDNAGLDRPSGGAAYAVFGKVVAGMDVVDAIKDAKVVADARGEVSKPVEPVEVTKASRLTEEDAKKLIK